MSEIRNLTRNGETFYPLTHVDGVIGRNGVPLGEVNDIFDVSEYNASGDPLVFPQYDTLALALEAVPQERRKGGMTIRYIDSVSGEYVQYRYMSTSTLNTDFINTTNWQGVDSELKAGSRNLAESGEVASTLATTEIIGKKQVFLTDFYGYTQKNGYYISDDGYIMQQSYSSYRTVYTNNPVNKGAVLHFTGTPSQSAKFLVAISDVPITDENLTSVHLTILSKVIYTSNLDLYLIVPFDGYIVFYRYNAYWSNVLARVCNITSLQDNSVLDISELNNASYATLAEALAAVPTTLQKGGICIRFINSVTSEYVQYELKNTEWSLENKYWYGINSMPYSITLLGNDKENVYSSYIDIKPSNSYRITLKNPDVPSDNVVFNNPGNYLRFGIILYDSNKQFLNTYAVSVYCDTIGNPLADYYDFIAPLNASYFAVQAKFNVGEALTVFVEDITSYRSQYREVPINGGVGVNYGNHQRIAVVDSVYYWRTNNIGLAYIAIIPVKAGEKYCIMRNASVQNTGTIHFLKSVPVLKTLQDMTLPDYCDTIQRIIDPSKSVGDKVYFIIPEDCNYIYCTTGWTNNNTNISFYKVELDASEKINILSRFDSFSIENNISIPFSHSEYISSDNTIYSWYSQKTISITDIPIALIRSVEVASGFKCSFWLTKGEMPTSEYTGVVTYTDKLDVEKIINETTYDYVPDRIHIIIKRTDDSTILDVDNLDNIIRIETVKKTSTRKYKLSGGTLSNSTGLYPTDLQYYLNRAHTPKFIKVDGVCTIKTLGLYGGILAYDKNQNYINSEGYDTTEGEYRYVPGYNTAYIRITASLKNDVSTVPVNNMIEIDGYWEGEPDTFQKLPADDGYQNVTFVVDVDTCKQPSTSVSEITQQYVKSTDSGVLHLPSTYTPDGEPTKLIIMLHGAAERYKSTSKRFGDNNPYKPEWDAAGYAQLDVDLIPDVYDYNGTNSSGSDDDYECVCGAYDWVINHFNIARDGVYLIGRSRGGHGVMNILSRLNFVSLPVICAISNAGAHFILNYILRASPSDTIWQVFCDSHGLPASGRPVHDSGQLFADEDVVTYLRSNIDIWWDKALAALPMLVENKSEYQTREEIFNMIVSVFSQSATGGAAYTDFLSKCRFHSPVPLRFDWCVGDTTQNWSTANHYSKEMKDAFVGNKINGNSVYREWPTCPSGTNAHYHEKFNLYSGNYTMPNGAVVENPSMAAVEWLLWCQMHDKRYYNSIPYGENS